MMDLLLTAFKGAMAFTATNLDDIIILMLLFSQVGTAFRRRHIVAGQYLGFGALVLISLSGFFGSFLLPRPWIGLLGVLPMVIGLSQLLSVEDDDDDSETAPLPASAAAGMGLLSPQTASVAAITMANGGDNVGVYMPMFASTDALGLGITLAIFFGLVGVWCGAAYRLTQVGAIAELLTRYGNYLVPFVLMGLGVLILIDSHTLEYRGLTALAMTILGLCTIHLLRMAPPLAQVFDLVPTAKKVKS
jgi:cadmium resistance transport/sequestration family protein